MPNSYGYRSGTRKIFSVPFREHGQVKLSTYMRVFRRGDLVDIKANPKIQKGMPHKVFHGKTGVVFDVTPRALAVDLNKRITGRVVRKRIYVRIEHVQRSACRDDYLRRKSELLVKKLEAKKLGVKINCKRQPLGPRPAYTLPIEAVQIQNVQPAFYEEVY